MKKLYLYIGKKLGWIEPTFIEMVQEFHEVFGHPIGDPKTPKPMNIKHAHHRMSFSTEEINEFLDACRENSNVGCLDANVDRVYFIGGDIVETGQQEIFQQAFKIVHTANMDKLCTSIVQAKKTVQKYQKEGIKTTIHPVGKGRFAVKDSTTGKIKKRVGWKAPEPKLRQLFRIND